MEYSYEVSGVDESTLSKLLQAFLPVLIVVGLIVLVLLIIYLVGLAKVFKKAGKPGWAAIVPYYNNWILTEIAGLKVYWFILMIVGSVLEFSNNNDQMTAISLVGSAISLVVSINYGICIAKKFGKSTAFGAIVLGIFGIIGYPILGFGSAQYTADSAEPNNGIFESK